MSNPDFEGNGSLWKKHNGKEELLVGTMKKGNVIYKVCVYPNKDKTDGEDPDFCIWTDEGEIDKSDPFWGYEYFLANI